jgi:hypothetical protein
MLDAVPDWSLDSITAPFFGDKTRMASYDVPFEAIDRILVAIELHELALAIENNNSVEVGPEEGLQALGVIYGILESGLAGRNVAVSDIIDGSINDYQQSIDHEIGYT